MTTKKTNTKNNKTKTLAVRLIGDLIDDLERAKEDAGVRNRIARVRAFFYLKKW